MESRLSPVLRGGELLSLRAVGGGGDGFSSTDVSVLTQEIKAVT